MSASSFSFTSSPTFEGRSHSRLGGAKISAVPTPIGRHLLPRLQPPLDARAPQLALEVDQLAAACAARAEWWY